MADQVTISGGPAVHKVRLLEEAEAAGTASTNAVNDDLVQYYKFLADKGDTTAQVGLGQLYLQGSQLVPVNYGEAFRYFEMAANDDNAIAEAYLGRMYAEGLGDLEQDYETALRYFTKSSDKVLISEGRQFFSFIIA